MSSTPHCFVGAVQKFATKGNTEIWGPRIGPDLFLLAKFCQKENYESKKSKMKLFWRLSEVIN